MVSKVRENLKSYLPSFARSVLVDTGVLSPPPYENLVLHDYIMAPDSNLNPRLTFVVPSLAAKNAFGGITTGIEVFLALGKSAGGDLRIVVDQIESVGDRSIVDKIAASMGLNADAIHIVPRKEGIPIISVRLNEIFIAYTWYIFANLKALVKKREEIFGGSIRPILYLIQDYEPNFYEFSSTHMMAMSVLDSKTPYWGIFNSHELFEYFQRQGHRCDRSYVFEPQISPGLRPFLGGEAPLKSRRILVYGRRYVPRNCFTSIESGLRVWARRYPEFSDWEVLSAGIWHSTIPIAPGRALRSLGKLSLEEYAQTLRSAAVGLSLMASPHPSYPPLEMAHFGVRTITNRYANKNLADTHENITSIDDISPETIADALAGACEQFIANPAAGWLAKSHRPSFVADGAFPFVEELAKDLRDIWVSGNSTVGPA